MPLDIDPRHVPVLLLCDVDPSWSRPEREEVLSLSAQLGDAVAAAGHPTTLLSLVDSRLDAALQPYDPRSCIVLNWCESVPGVPRSEPQVARTLESLGYTFTGADAGVLERTQDKPYVKQILAEAKIPTPAWRVCESAAAGNWHRFPAIVKPVREHCSEGITRESVVMNHGDLRRRIAYILETYDQPALVEDFIDGREFHVSLWGNGTVDVLPPAEMDFSRFSEIQDRLCTYDAKFVPGSLHYEGIQTLLPAPLDEGPLAALMDVCRAAYRILGCRDYGRIDVRSRGGVFFVLDVNPNADISPDASLACCAQHAGHTYGETASRIVRLAARRHPVWGPAGTAAQPAARARGSAQDEALPR